MTTAVEILRRRLKEAEAEIDLMKAEEAREGPLLPYRDPTGRLINPISRRTELAEAIREIEAAGAPAHRT